MASPSTRFDIVVGIDFGMTCTGVAYSYGPEWPFPKTIQRWPGKLGHEVRNKVDTAVAYSLQDGSPVSWGFLCNPDDDTVEYSPLFKLHLDPFHKDPFPDSPANEDARRWLKDYLQYLYSYLIRHFSNIFSRFESRSIDFVFSVPVTWRNNPTLIADIESIARAAGFGSRPRDVTSISMTEAEAAAIYASRGSLKQDDVFLVVDAGGGTMDLNVLKVSSAISGSIELYPLSWTEGAAIGSTLIDFKVRSVVKQRLSTVQDHLDEDLSDLTTKMMVDKFEAFKCSFGNPGVEVARLVLPIPGLKAGVDLPLQGIEDSKIVITRAELQQIFDDQVDRMCALIDSQMKIVRDRYASASIDYLVLSGGLGSSPYVQSCIRAKYEDRAGNTPRSGKLQVLVSDEPQLAVCHGLVIARTQSNISSNDVMSRRCSPLSFGILTREPYDPAKHRGENVVQDPFDKRFWAHGQIQWILTQGQVVRANHGVSEKYSIKIQMGQELEPWRTTIVLSTLPTSQLPRSMRSRGASVICSVETVLDTRDMKRKNSRWYNLRPEYNHAEFLVRMIVGTGLRFEICSTDGSIRSRSHEEIAIQWMNPDADTLTPGNHWGLKEGLGPFEVSSPDPSELSGFSIAHELATEPLR